MKIPRIPPGINELFQEFRTSSGFQKMVDISLQQASEGKYLHWDQLVHLTPPEGLSHREWWFALKLRRQAFFKKIPLLDRKGNTFRYLVTDPIPKILHEIDLGAGGRIEMPAQITNPETKDRYYVASLIEEAITSSQLEGAATTRQVAKEMIREGREPRNRSEQMIFNNYLTMKEVGIFKEETLTPELVFHIHRQVTEGTLDNPTAAGRFRKDDEYIVVSDPSSGATLHHPPSADELEGRLAAMCDFANSKTSEEFLHPVLRSIILHFWLAYDHPFVDGNGRTARALFYWSMLHHGYWLCEYIAISHILRKAPAKYSRAFLYAETDENDLTYFILYHLDVVDRAIQALHDYIRRKTEELNQVETELKNLAMFNHRQQALLSHALRHPNFRYTIQGHQTSHSVVYETARTDLLGLQKHGLLRAEKTGRKWYFMPVANFDKKLASAL